MSESLLKTPHEKKRLSYSILSFSYRSCFACVNHARRCYCIYLSDRIEYIVVVLFAGKHISHVHLIIFRVTPYSNKNELANSDNCVQLLYEENLLIFQNQCIKKHNRTSRSNYF